MPKGLVFFPTLAKYMTKKSHWVLIGRRPVMEALQSGEALDKVLIDRQATIPGVIELCKQQGVPLQKVPKEKLDKFGANHQGLAAFKSQVEYTALEDLIPHLFESGEVPLLLVLDHITDVGNFGAISRSAEVMGAHAIIFPAQGSAQINANAIKRSSGALLRIPLCRTNNLVGAVRFLKDSGITILCADEKGKTALPGNDLRQPVAFILGSEGEGIAAPLLRMADELVFIAQPGTMDSLNVAVAAGILLYETQRQRGKMEMEAK